MAGGGVKPGLTYGETDDMGSAISGKIHVHDLHATMLHQLGIDHLQLTHRHLGRDFRLTDVYGEVVKDARVSEAPALDFSSLAGIPHLCGYRGQSREPKT